MSDSANATKMSNTVSSLTSLWFGLSPSTVHPRTVQENNEVLCTSAVDMPWRKGWALRGLHKEGEFPHAISDDEQKGQVLKN